MKTSELGVSTDYKIAFKKKNWKPLCHINEKVLIFNKGKFLLLNLNNYETELIYEFKEEALYGYFFKSRILTRLFRLEPRAVLKINQGNILIPLKGKIYHLDIETKKLEEVHQFRREMSAPLNMTKIENISGINRMYCYGEYFSNSEKDEVRIWGCKNEDYDEWQEVYRFKKGEINHIHEIVPDPYKDRIWILTGDYEDSAGIWFTDDGFQTVERYLNGKQKYRSCVAFATPKGLIYATDTPLEENHIYYLTAGKNIEKIHNLEGSSIYGTKIKNDYFFSTTVEGHSDGTEGRFNILSYKRGKGIKSWYSELVIGNPKEGFKCIGRFKKDIWPMGLMQFGTIMFPSGDNQTNKIVLYGSTLKKIDGTLVILENR